jgi:hypothetical protein
LFDYFSQKSLLFWVNISCISLFLHVCFSSIIIYLDVPVCQGERSSCFVRKKYGSHLTRPHRGWVGALSSSMVVGLLDRIWSGEASRDGRSGRWRRLFPGSGCPVPDGFDRVYGFERSGACLWKSFLMVVVVVASGGGPWRRQRCRMGRDDWVKTLGCFSFPSPRSHLSLVEGRLAAGHCP